MKQFLVVLVVVVVSVIVEGEGSSYCMTSTGYQQEPSLYLRVCCVNSNLGKTVRIRENNREKIMICPSVRINSCPSGKLNPYFIINDVLQSHCIRRAKVFLPGDS